MNRAINPNRDQLRGIARRAMLERGLLPDFSAAVLVETDAIGKPAEADPSFRDLRNLLWTSIDNDDSRDLDQLTVAVPMAGGAVKILVAVADVDAIVKRGSAIDGHARANTTSVYTAAEIFSMLPEKLSTDLTSLGESQERLAVVIEMGVSSGDGVVNGSDIYRAVVVNHAKLAYNGVSAWLEGASPRRRGAGNPSSHQSGRTQRYGVGARARDRGGARPGFVLGDVRPRGHHRQAAPTSAPRSARR